MLIDSNCAWPMASKQPLIAKPASADRIERFFEKILLRISTSRMVDGLWLGASEGDCELSLDRVEAALRLIKACDPRRYQRIARDLDRIWVHLLNGNTAQYKKSISACEIDIRFVLDEHTTLELIASTIVHEATHARLEHRGIQYDEPRRDRIEKVCIRQQLLFASRLPDGQRAYERAQSSLESSLDLTDAAFRRRLRLGRLETMRYLGAPEWLLRGMRMLRARRIRASRRSGRKRA
jgi:hypothetical protein